MKHRLVVLLLFIFTNAGFAQYSLDDTLNAEGFIDGLIQAQLKDRNIAGATFSLVKDGKLFITKGYGYADLANKTPVDPGQTLFRIGSISKMFVWIALMQLLQQGKINLDDNINAYFDSFQIPDTYSQPITIKNLMTHTPGFEDYLIGLFAKDSTSVRPLEEILANEIPVRIRPAGSYASYSNHGTGLAALIVEKVSGKEWNIYVEEHILQPLGMTSTTFRQPLPSSLGPKMSKGYLFDNGEFVLQDFEYVPLAPVGAASSTATDMAKFMIMNLQKGVYDSLVLLDSATAELMQSPAHQHTADVNPMRHGFMDVSQNKQTIIGHGGDTFWFHSMMALWPEHNVGLFVSFNSQNGGGAYFTVLEEFTDRYFPEYLAPVSGAPKDELERFAGEYGTNRYPHKRLTRISKLMGVTKVSVTDDGALKTMSGEEVEFWYKIGEMTFRNKDNSNVIAFEADEAGNITHMFLGLLPIFTLEKLNSLDTPRVQLTILALVMMLLLVTLIYWPVVYFSRRRYQPKDIPPQVLPVSSKVIGWIGCFILIVFYLGIAMIFSNPFEIVFGIPGTLKGLLLIPFLIILLLVVMLVHVIAIWKNHKSSLWGRLYYSTVWLAMVTAVWQLNYWNFLGFKY